jgi:hypothetical protein
MDRRVAGFVTVAGVAVFAAGTLSLHLLQPQLSPLDEAVSYYVHGAHGWLLTLGLLALGAGSLALGLGLASGARGRGSRPGRRLVLLWAACVLIGGVFRADPPGSWDRPPSLSGMIHGNAALLAFIALPIGALCLARSFAEDARWRPHARLLRALAVACLVTLVLFAASLAPVFVRPGPPILLGASERLLLAVYAAWLAATGLGLSKQEHGVIERVRTPSRGR